VTADEVLTACCQAGIVLTVDGDALEVDAPAGVLTPELRDALTRLKPALLVLLAPPRAFVTLKHGPTLPIEAIELAINLEERGFRMRVDQHEQFQIEPAAALTETDRAGIRRWRLHLSTILSYDADALEAVQ